jgi:hypothetical protein
VDIAINGSSRAQFHYDPRIIEQVTGHTAYNLGMIGARIEVQLAVLRTYLKHNPKPKLVVQNLESFIFTTARKGEIIDPGLFAPYLNEEDLYKPLVQIDPVVWKWKYIPLYVYTVEDGRFLWVRGLLGWLGKSGPETFYQGFNPNYERWTTDGERFHPSEEKNVILKIEPQAVAALTELIQLCRDREIDVILVYSPEYFGTQGYVRNRDEIFATFRQIGEKFQVPLWDYSDSPISRQQENFYTSTHLNSEGASRFSADFAKRLAEHSTKRLSAARAEDRRERRP